MNILSISAQKPDSTGSGVYLAQTSAAFARTGHRAAIVAGIDARDEPAIPPGVEFYPVRYNTCELPFNVCGMSDTMPYPSTRYRDMTPTMVEQLYEAFRKVVRRAVDEFKPDLIVCHHLYLVTSLVARLGLQVPVVAICHNTDLRQMRTHDLEHERVIEGVRRLDHVLALHEAQAEQIAEVYGVPRDRISIVGTGYDARVFRRDQPAIAVRQDNNGACATTPDAADVRGARHTAPVSVCYAGKIAYKKGVLSLLACLPHLGEAADGMRLYLAGGSGSQEETTQARDLATQAPCSVEFLGRIDPARLAQVYNACDVFVLPSFYEGLPLVVIEALACGCRVVLSDLPGIRPWLESRLPGAPITYVAPPRMVDVDEPDPDDLPRFETDLARALASVARDVRQFGRPVVDTSHLTWDAVARRIVGR